MTLDDAITAAVDANHKHAQSPCPQTGEACKGRGCGYFIPSRPIEIRAGSDDWSITQAHCIAPERGK
jgi:hypothetical protein